MENANIGHLQIKNSSFEQLRTFTSLRTTLHEIGGSWGEISARIVTADECYITLIEMS